MAATTAQREGRDRGGGPMKGKERRAPPPTFRTAVRRQAEALGVPADAFERALILGQLVALLSQHPRMRHAVAFKGGAIMRLVDQSPRLSRDLDSSELQGRRVEEKWVRDALSTTAARRVVLGVERIVRRGTASISFLVRCRPLTGGEEIPITVSVNWEEPLVLPPEQALIELPNREQVRVPVVHRAERAAEKVRAFLGRGEANDAHDLHWYGTRVLRTGDWKVLPHLVRRKLHLLRVRPNTDLHRRFEEMRANAAGQWRRGQGLVVVANPPVWEEVDQQLTRLKRLIPQRLRVGRQRQ